MHPILKYFIYGDVRFKRMVGIENFRNDNAIGF